MNRTAYQPADVFVPAGNTCSHGVIVEAGRTLYVAGQTPRDVQGNIVCKGDAAGQTRQTLENMKRVVAGAKWAGMQTAFIGRPGQQVFPLAEPPDIKVADFAALADVLGA